MRCDVNILIPELESGIYSLILDHVHVPSSSSHRKKNSSHCLNCPTICFVWAQPSIGYSRQIKRSIKKP